MVCCLPLTLKQPSLKGLGKDAPKPVLLPFSVKLELLLPWLVFPVEDKFLVGVVGVPGASYIEVSLPVENWHKTNYCTICDASSAQGYFYTCFTSSIVKFLE